MTMARSVHKSDVARNLAHAKGTSGDVIGEKELPGMPPAR